MRLKPLKVRKDPTSQAAVRFESYGYREIIWCHVINEPAWLHWKNDTPFCEACKWTDEDYKSTETEHELGTFFLQSHTWICGINKPSKEQGRS